MDNISILIIEDNPVNSVYLEKLIEKISKSEDNIYIANYITELAEDLKEAKKKLKKGSFDLVFLDLTLPDSKPKSTFKSIHKITKAPIIILTANDDTIMAIDAVKSGAADYLIKGKLNVDIIYRSIHYALERAKSLEALKKSEERYALVLEATNDGVWEWFVDEQKIYLSTRWKEILGYKNKEIGDSDKEWFNRIHPEDQERVKKEFDVHFKGTTKSLVSEHRISHKNGSYIWVRVHGKASKANNGSKLKIAGSLSDITTEKLEDTLTGLPNKVLFMDRLQTFINRLNYSLNEKFVLITIELDNFKLVSYYGAKTADIAVVTIIHRIKGSLRENDILARTGNIEFSLILQKPCDLTEVNKLTRHLQKVISKPIKVESFEISVSTGMGVVFSNQAYTHAREMFLDSLTALQKALSKGRGRYEIFDAQMREKVLRIVEMEGKLLRAIERCEFTLFYQPIYSLLKEKITGVEALIRWENDDNIINPVEFIPIAEQTDMIKRLGTWVIEECMLQAQRWKMKGLADLNISINFSGRQFADEEVIQYLIRTLQISKMKVENFHVEVTESVAMENQDYSIKVLTSLSKMGFQISIDDFGTGYSSLAYLKKLPLNKLKIDKSFINEIPMDEESNAIVKALIQMSHSLQYQVIVEGVEKQEQLEFVKELGAEFIQGYYIAKPMLGDEVENFVRKFKLSNQVTGLSNQ